jgi:hypothetical protein
MSNKATERSRRWREKRSRQGGRPLSVWLTPDTAQKLDDIVKRSGDPIADAVAKAIDCLHESGAIGEPPQITLFDVASNAIEPSIPTEPKPDPLNLADLKKRLDQGESIQALRPDLTKLVTVMTESGVSTRAIAARLNDAGLPTLSGRGVWQKGIIGRLLQATKQK